MNNIKGILEELIPGYNNEFPSKVITCAETLYRLSLRDRPVLPNNSEIARSHICVFVAATKYHEQLNIPSPLANKIPAPPRVATKLVTDFTDNLLNQIVSAASTPVTTPRKRRITGLLDSPIKSLTPSPRKLQNLNNNAPKTSSPLKRKLQDLQNEKDDDEFPSTPTKTPKRSATLLDDFENESPFNPKSSPLKLLKQTKLLLPTKSMTASSPTSSPSKIYVYDKKHVKVTDLITFCNNFHIPAKFTPLIIQAFLEHKHKFHKKTEWLLACGLVHAAYVRINNGLLQGKMGAKTTFQDQLFTYQKGGLMKKTMLSWCNIIEDAFKAESWIMDIELEYVYKNKSIVEANESREVEAKLGKGWDLFELMGSMINSTTVLDSDSQSEYYKIWTQLAKAQLHST
ncbi:uncharacterized protein KQ657_003691 [Scheffersomyces spartinae]|uniref:ORC6 first cyclin-like domain-containing protein n=1 Tax=Scheffersomyces spartinae TaxID=45513 RepID=A0A9P8AKI0_9ASCO|nr:uncharacterized protein KQ657_003691 [Scheffersomyces spartinae]KAG7195167.1 hypothetical protein KQ657_003691 [Scheffersomyces spartinae]